MSVGTETQRLLIGSGGAGAHYLLTYLRSVSARSDPQILPPLLPSQSEITFTFLGLKKCLPYTDGQTALSFVSSGEENSSSGIWIIAARG